MKNLLRFWFSLALLITQPGLAAAASLHSSQPLAVMENKPRHRWDVAAWLQLNEETMTAQLRGASGELSDKDFVWGHVKVDYVVLHGTPLIPGKKKFYAAEVPTVPQGSLWAARDGKVITGYKRKADSSENEDGFAVVSIDKPRIKGDKFVYAPMTMLYIDDEGKVYY